MILSRKVIGAHAFLFLEGSAFTVPTAGTAGRAAKPGAADTAWIDAGIADWDIEQTGTTEPLMAPAPGARQLYDEIVTSKGLKLSGQLKELSNLAYQLLLSTGALPVSPTAGGQYNPLEGQPVVRAWFKLQQYDQGNNLINTLDVFVALKVTGAVAFADKGVDVPVEANVLYSTLNTGTLT